LACVLISVGKFEKGYEEYEWRFKLPKVKQFTNLLPKVPIWNGEPLKNKRILLFCEQGGGDLVQFIRYAKLLDGHVSVTATNNLVKLVTQCEGVDEVIPFNSDDATTLPENFDYMVSMMSLPKYFGINKSKEYIKPKPVSPWWNEPSRSPGASKTAKKIDKNNFNIGIVWAGNDMHEHDFARSCHLKHFEVLQDIPKVKLYSLQKGEQKRTWKTDGNVNLLEGSENVKYEDYTSFLDDFNDTANFIKELDLIISVDTATAHIAAAMGKPVWLLMGFYPDYRWGIKKNKTHWYPSMKLFRQKDYGKDWNYVFANVKKELEKLPK